MRVFVASTLPALARALQAGQVGPGPLPGFAVTPTLREAYFSGDAEELEYAALTEAARASLRLIAADPVAPPRRVVLAAEMPAEQVSWDARDDEPARVVILQPVPLARVASAHVDDTEAGADVRRAGRLPRQCMGLRRGNRQSRDRAAIRGATRRCTPRSADAAA